MTSVLCFIFYFVHETFLTLVLRLRNVLTLLCEQDLDGFLANICPSSTCSIAMLHLLVHGMNVALAGYEKNGVGTIPAQTIKNALNGNH